MSNLTLIEQCSPANPAELAWFANWVSVDTGFLPRAYSRVIVVMHPGTIQADGPIPYLAPNANDEDLSDEQTQFVVERLLTRNDPELPCSFALYGGFANPEQAELLTHTGLSCVVSRLDYFVGSETLRRVMLALGREQLSPPLPLSFVWPETREWFFASAPDLAFTAIGCTDDLADWFLAANRLDVVEWENSPTDR